MAGEDYDLRYMLDDFTNNDFEALDGFDFDAFLNRADEGYSWDGSYNPPLDPPSSRALDHFTPPPERRRQGDRGTFSQNVNFQTRGPASHRPHTNFERETARHLPEPTYSEGWLEPETRRRQEQAVNHSLDSYNNFDDSPLSPSSAHSSFGSAFDIDDILNENENDMPTARRRNGRNSVVDLTDLPSSPTSPPPRQPTSLKRAAESSNKPSTPKRRRLIKNEDSEDEKENNNVEELDLTNEAPNAEEELAQTQQQLLLTTQQENSTGPLNLGKRTCIICMEPFTNATITSCGHMYCHECLTQALIAGEKSSEKGIGNCPVCRKPVNRKKGHQMIPIAFMKKSAFKGKAKRQMAVLG